jgi:hypothetical protein
LRPRPAFLADRFETILDNLEALGDWSLALATPGRINLGSLGGIETGIRRLMRKRPLETEEVEVRGERLVAAPPITRLLTCPASRRRNRDSQWTSQAVSSVLRSWARRTTCLRHTSR